MKLENICVSFEYAKKLKEIGIKQESLFVWNKKTEFKIDGILQEKITVINLEFYKNPLLLKETFYSAFTASELINILPYSINNWLYFSFDKEDNFYYTRYTDNNNNVYTHAYGKDKSLEASLSKLLIYLIESKLVSVEEINERI